MNENPPPEQGRVQPGGSPEGGQPTQPAGPYTPPPIYGPPQGGGAPTQAVPPQPGTPGQGYPQYGQYPQQGYQQVPPPGYPPQPQGYGPPPQPGYAYPAQVQKKGGIPVWGWILIALAALIVLGCAGCALTGVFTAGILGTTVTKFAQPVVAVTTFYADLEQGKYQQAHDILSSRLADQYSTDTLRTKWTAFTDAGGTIGTMTNINVKNNNATVNWRLVSGSGNSYPIDITLVQSGGSWKIDGADPGLIPEP